MTASIIKFEKPVTTESVTQEVIRPEINIEKMAQIWQPARAKEKLNKIVIERPNGARIQVTANSEYGPPTTETQKVLYALYQISEEQGHPRRFYFSRQKIARILKKPLGKWADTIIERCLKQLRFTAFVLKDSFYDVAQKAIITPEDNVTILAKLKTITKTDGHITKEACYAEFDEIIYRNLVNNYVKPLRFETLLSLGDDGIAQIFYIHLDLILSSGELSLGVYKRRSKELFQEFNLVGKEYEKLNFRKRTLERVKEKLNGKELSKGGVLKIEIEKTKDQQDYLLIANTVTQLPLKFDDPQPQAEIQPDPPRPPTRQSKPELIPVQVPGGTPTELVQHFHKTFFKLDGVEPQTNELKQAADLINQHGFEIARYIVDYGFKQAQETSFNIAVFGGIIQYAGRAKAKYKRNQEARERVRQAEELERLIDTCPLGCWRNSGKVFWVKIDSQSSAISQMDCLHDKAKHREEEQKNGIKIAITRDTLKTSSIEK